MINRKYILLLTAAVLLPLAGCLKDLGPEDGGSITVEASIGAQTKVTHEGDVSTFAEGDQIAVYAWTGSASAVPDTRVVNGVVNTLGSGGWTPESAMRWKNLTDAHYFLGVSPVHTISDFSAGEYELYKNTSLSADAQYAANDLLVATVLGEGLKASGGAVPLGFKHVMARLSVNVTLGNTLSASDVSGVTVLAKKLAVVDYLSQTASASSTAVASDLALFPSGTTLGFTGPQVPQEGVRQITVSVAGVDYVYTSGSDIPLEPGKHTTVNLVVGNDWVELSGVSVSDWVASGTLDGGEAVVVKPHVPYLTFTSSGTSKLSLMNEGGNAPKLYYSYDTANWTEWDYSELTFTRDTPLYMYGDNAEGFNFSKTKYSYFSETENGDSYEISGDIMSLLDKDAGLTKIPNEYCFCWLFRNCLKMTQAPSLPATELTPFCYYSLFFDCEGLKKAPELPATSLAPSCYKYMFERCSALSAGPELPAMTLAEGCYYGMFTGCTSLTAAPTLPATTLATNCYNSMFAGCSQLSYVKCLALNPDQMLDWLKNVADKGTFVKNAGATTWSADSSGIPENWTVEDQFASRYLTFTSSGTSSIALSNKEGNAPKLYYSTNLSDWTEWNYSELTFSSTAPLYLCGNNPDGFNYSDQKYSSFVAGGDQFGISGDIMSLIDKNAECKEIPDDECFQNLFSGCGLLTQAPELPATTLTRNCYTAMFTGCTGLTEAPELPALTLADACYSMMFQSCTGLKTAPTLPATTLAERCYLGMFLSCTGLKTAPSLPATTLVAGCYYAMFLGCTGLTEAPELPALTLADACYSMMFQSCTHLKTAPKLSATTLAKDCYESMFAGCTSLETAPALPATTLAESCYMQMFFGCTALTAAPALDAMTLANSCYYNMFNGCTSLETAPALPATTLAERCYYSMFKGCKSLTAAPELPATKLEVACYYSMFKGCSQLSYVKCLAVFDGGTSYTNYWLDGVADSGTFVRNTSATSWPKGSSGIPTGWTVLKF